MSRNRKNQSAGVRFGPVLKVFVLCVFFAGAGIGYVWLQEQIQVLSRRMAEKEHQVEELRSQNIRFMGHLEELRSPRTLDARVRELTPGLGIPQPDQVVRLVEAHPAAPVLIARQPSLSVPDGHEAIR